MSSLGRGACAAAILIAAACSFDTEGNSGAGNSLGSGSPTGNDTDDGSSGISATRGSDSLTSGSTTGTENETGDSSEQTSSTGEPPETTGPTNDEAAFLTFSALEFSFTPVALGSSGTLTVDVTNEGMADATSLATTTLDDPFHYVDGYPGEGGTCGTTISPAETCTIVLTHAPTMLGRASGTLVLGYHDGAISRTTAPASIDGDGTGLTENLMRNGSAASGVEHWQALEPPSWTSVTDTSSSDDGFSFTPTGESIDNRHLRQTVDISGFSAANQDSTLRYEFSVHAKTDVPTDDYAVSIQINGGAWSMLEVGDQSTWKQVVAAGSLPPGALSNIQVELECITPIGLNDCDARFDAATLRLAYP